MAAKLKVVKPTQPPRKLGAHGGALWRSIMSEYQIEDGGGLSMLAQACIALDRAEQCRVQIERDGVVLRTKTGLKDDPALKHELASRSFVVRTLRESAWTLNRWARVRRPPVGFGIRGIHDDD